jgi:hypothetical protein
MNYKKYTFSFWYLFINTQAQQQQTPATIKICFDHDATAHLGNGKSLRTAHRICNGKINLVADARVIRSGWCL